MWSEAHSSWLSTKDFPHQAPKATDASQAHPADTVSAFLVTTRPQPGATCIPHSRSTRAPLTHVIYNNRQSQAVPSLSWPSCCHISASYAASSLRTHAQLLTRQYTALAHSCWSNAPSGPLLMRCKHCVSRVGCALPLRCTPSVKVAGSKWVWRLRHAQAPGPGHNFTWWASSGPRPEARGTAARR